MQHVRSGHPAILVAQNRDGTTTRQLPSWFVLHDGPRCDYYRREIAEGRLTAAPPSH